MNVLVIDVGGTSVKARIWGSRKTARFDSGKRMTPAKMVDKILELTKGWTYNAVSMGIPAVVIQGRIVEEPGNLGAGWIRFDFAAKFQRPVKIINDAAMQALGSYRGGRMLFLSLGTGLGSAMILDDVIVPLELGHLPFRGRKLGEALGRKAAEKNFDAWKKRLYGVLKVLTEAFRTDSIVLGGGNAKRLHHLPPGIRKGSNEKAFLGGARLWGGGAMRAKPKKHTWVLT